MDLINSVFQKNKKERQLNFAISKLMTLSEVKELKELLTPHNDGEAMIFNFFRSHGQFCASRPWEVIFVFLTLVLCTASMTFFEPRLQFQRTDDEGIDTKTSDMLILSIARCLSILYIYVQFSKLRRLGSKYLLALAGLMTILFSFSISVAVVNFLGANLSELSDATPFFLLLVDLSKACTLAKFALSSDTQEEVVTNIGHGMALVGPVLTLDAIVETLVIGVGTLSGIRTLQAMCCFGCLSVMANYFAFMCFYPACLSIIIELTRDTRRLVQIQQLAKVWQTDDEDQKPNPVVQKVKIIMSAGLFFVHAHSRFFASTRMTSFMGDPLTESTNQLSSSALTTSAASMGQNHHQGQQFWEFALFRSTTPSADHLITIIVVVVLFFKYIFIDSDYNNNQPTTTTTPVLQETTTNIKEEVTGNKMVAKGRGILKFVKSVSFMEEYGNGGDDNVDDSDSYVMRRSAVVGGSEIKRRRSEGGSAISCSGIFSSGCKKYPVNNYLQEAVVGSGSVGGGLDNDPGCSAGVDNDQKGNSCIDNDQECGGSCNSSGFDVGTNESLAISSSLCNQHDEDVNKHDVVIIGDAKNDGSNIDGIRSSLSSLKESSSSSKFFLDSDDGDDDDDDGDDDEDKEIDNTGLTTFVKKVNGRRVNKHNNNSNKQPLVTSSTQTESDDIMMMSSSSSLSSPLKDDVPCRSIEECAELLKDVGGPEKLTDEEIMKLVGSKHIPAYRLEHAINDFQRGVQIRRQIISKSLPDPVCLDNLPFTNYDYKLVDGACCENVIGYMPIPVGVAGPLLVNGKSYMVPMATTEGCLVASTNRGCRALSANKIGVTSKVIRDGMTRAPLVRLPSGDRASQVKCWLEVDEHFQIVADAFNSTSRFARLQKLRTTQVGRSLYIRFVARTGDAMGMNMLSKGSEKALLTLQEHYFNDMEILSLSGNMCTDKKPSAVNWIEGRGKSVVCEAVVPNKVIRDVLKTSVSSLVDLNVNKNLIGSIMAGSIGGFNAHAANLVTAIYLATGQDPAQNVCSSNCITIMEAHHNADTGDDDLYISCTMPSLEVGTVGGGTILAPQGACLEMLGVRGSNNDEPGSNACTLANIICSAVMAGELSLMSALASGDLVKSHLKHNRSSANITASQSSNCLVP